MRARRLSALSLVLLISILLAGRPCAQPAPEPEFDLWVHLFFSVRDDAGVERAKSVLRRAAKAGFSHALLADWSLLRPMSDEYRANLAEVKALADELGIDLVPGVMNIGYAGDVLAENPNLDEGLPVRDALFVVEGGEARLVPDPAPYLRDGGFESPEGNVFGEWDWQDDGCMYADRDVVHGGACSLRMTDIGTADPEHGHGRICQVVDVAPFRCYRLSVWMKTADFDPDCLVQVYVADMQSRPRTFSQISPERDQDWYHYTLIFNSLDATQVRVYVGVWSGKSGSIWWDDLEIAEAGLVNVLRRDGCPFVVRGENGAVYEEGRDYERVPGLGEGSPNWEWWDGRWPEEMPIRLTADSRIREGERLRVSFHHAARVLAGGQTMCCLSEPETYEILREEIARVEAELHPKTWFMNHDEIRVANWCQACQARGMTPGEMLADNVRKCVEIIREVSPDSEIWVWSDMFDPNHNAHDDYYCVNGTWAGSWEGLPSDVCIANWYHGGGVETMRWFAERGHKQILCGYYDTSNFYTDEWLATAQAEGIPNVVGAMYTTWVPQYDDLEAWAEAVKGARP